jgi:hypothetical protein
MKHVPGKRYKRNDPATSESFAKESEARSLAMVPGEIRWLHTGKGS